MKPIPEVIAELRAMNVPELVERYAEVFGRLPRTKQPTWLWRKIAWKIQEQRFGGLSQAAKERLEELIAEIDLPWAGSPRSTTVQPWAPRFPGSGRGVSSRQRRSTAVGNTMALSTEASPPSPRQSPAPTGTASSSSA